MLFSGEQPTLDNSQAKKTLNAPRNIGFVKVPRDMDDKRVLSKGPVEKGGFYNFGGGWAPQENKGVTWLTHSKSMDQNACRIKVTKLTNGQVLVYFETWNGGGESMHGSSKFLSSHLMTLDHNGKITRAARPTKFPVRLPFADEILRTDTNTAVFYAGDKVGSTGKLVRYEVSLTSGPGAGTNKAVTTKAPMVTQAVKKLPILTKDLGSALPSPFTITHAI